MVDATMTGFMDIENGKRAACCDGHKQRDQKGLTGKT
jgi:hypothetical protein